MSSGKTDPVRPPHYHRDSGHEVIDVIAAWGLDFDRGNVIKYVARAGMKGDALTDLKKARAYLDHAIAQIEKSPVFGYERALQSVADDHQRQLHSHRKALKR